MNLIDMHCDTLGAGIIHKKDTITHLLGTMVDIERLRKADVRAQFFAMFLPQRNNPEWFGYEKMPSGEELMEEMYGIFQNTAWQARWKQRKARKSWARNPARGSSEIRWAREK